MVENSKGVMKGDPSQFELLKVLGQGSFGKVSHGDSYSTTECVCVVNIVVLLLHMCTYNHCVITICFNH